MLNYHYFFIEGYEKPFGYVHNRFIDLFDWPTYWKIEPESRFLTLTTGSDFAARTRLMCETLQENYMLLKLPTSFAWADELFPLHTASGEHVLDMYGCGVDVFGIINYSVHMIGWLPMDGGIKIWVPQRSLTKWSFPGMLDTTVGGSLATGEKPIDGIIRECQEEISLNPDYTRANIRPCGTNSFQLTVNDLLQPACQLQVQYLYELEMSPDVAPTIGDGEVAELHLMTVAEVEARLKNREFKPTCLMAYLAFFIRHGYLSAENEPDLVEINSRLNRKLTLFVV